MNIASNFWFNFCSANLTNVDYDSRHITTGLILLQKKITSFISKNIKTSKKLKKIQTFRFSVLEIQSIPEKWYVCDKKT